MVAWQAWGEAAFARARETGRPVLLSLGATWCGACHRMDEETWDDPGVAAVVDATTVPIRVDADERPDLYGRYHLGGLPSTAVLSPDGEFLRGGTFLSPTQLLGLLDQRAALAVERPRIDALEAGEGLDRREALPASGERREHRVLVLDHELQVQHDRAG